MITLRKRYTHQMSSAILSKDIDLVKDLAKAYSINISKKQIKNILSSNKGKPTFQIADEIWDFNNKKKEQEAPVSE